MDTGAFGFLAMQAWIRVWLGGWSGRRRLRWQRRDTYIIFNRLKSLELSTRFMLSIGKNFTVMGLLSAKVFPRRGKDLIVQGASGKTGYVTLSRTVHAGQGWRRPRSLAFSAQMATVPIVASELRVAWQLPPLAFRRREDEDSGDGFDLVALLSPVAGRNLFLGARGRWATGYVPLALRLYPFDLTPGAAAGELVIRIDAASGLLAETGVSGVTPFFTLAGAPSPALEAVATSLKKFRVARARTRRIVDALAAQNLLVPWVPECDAGAGEPLSGLFRVDEPALKELDGEALQTLNRCGALLVVYGQMLTISRLRQFNKQAGGRLHPSQAEEAGDDGNPLSDLIRFDGL